MEQGGLKYKSHPVRKRAVGEEGGGGMEGNGDNVQLAINIYSASCAEVVTTIASLK